MRELDCRHLSCPAPVLQVKKVLEESGLKGVRVLVDAGAARENVSRFAVSRGFAVQESDMGDYFALEITSSGVLERGTAISGGVVMLIASDSLGSGPDELGKLLMKNFLISLLESSDPPEKILLINSGVLLTVSGGESVEALQKLISTGAEVLACGVCLDYFSVKEKHAVGGVTNMLTIAESMLQARTVIRL